ncbi:MAG: hypothetical protein R3A50_16605 [Saprospiraceae bacterium]
MIISQPISLVEQARVLGKMYPNAEVQLLSSNAFFYEPNLPQLDWQLVFRQISFPKDAELSVLMCDIKLRPKVMSREYWVRIIYKVGQRPLVYVKFPKLSYRRINPLPHFNSDNTLCLYHGPKEWDGTMLLAETIVPWSSEWLFHYEIWEGIEDWCGGGV